MLSLTQCVIVCRELIVKYCRGLPIPAYKVGVYSNYIQEWLCVGTYMHSVLYLVQLDHMWCCFQAGTRQTPPELAAPLLADLQVYCLQQKWVLLGLLLA